eukprot:5150729-Ditylum_brightwellii.AAC.1
MVGYATKHEANCYKILDPCMGTVYETHDIIWLKCMYYKKALPVRDEDNILQTWPENSDPGVGLPVLKARDTNAIDNNKSDDNDDDNNDETKSILDIGEGENIPVSEPPTSKVTCSGCVSKIPSHLAKNYEFIGHTTDAKRVDVQQAYHQISLTPAEQKYYAQMRELNELSFLSVDRESNQLEGEC